MLRTLVQIKWVSPGTTSSSLLSAEGFGAGAVVAGYAGVVAAVGLGAAQLGWVPVRGD